MSYLTDEIASQPGCWARAIEMAGSAGAALPGPGERVAAIGCGSSLNVARCYAALREIAGQGQTDAFPASEVPATRRYDRLVYISRTGTTTEVLDALRAAPRDAPATAITAEADAPLAREARHVVLLDFADERSVVSSRFITSSIVLLRAQLGTDVRSLPAEAEREAARRELLERRHLFCEVERVVQRHSRRLRRRLRQAQARRDRTLMPSTHTADSTPHDSELDWAQ